MVVGKDAAQTPSRFNVFSSVPSATTSGGAHAKQAVSPGETNLKFYRIFIEKRNCREKYRDKRFS